SFLLGSTKILGLAHRQWNGRKNSGEDVVTPAIVLPGAVPEEVGAGGDNIRYGRLTLAVAGHDVVLDLRAVGVRLDVRKGDLSKLRQESRAGHSDADEVVIGDDVVFHSRAVGPNDEYAGTGRLQRGNVARRREIDVVIVVYVVPAY